MKENSSDTKSTDQLIEDYCSVLDDYLCDPGDDDLRCRLHDAGMALKGRLVSADVQWRNGKTSSVTGTVTAMAGEFVYLDSDLGNVEGIASSMAAAE